MADDEPQELSSYKEDLREWWKNITELSIAFRNGLMVLDQNGKAIGCDPDISRSYISNMGRFWLEILPLVQGRSELKDLQAEFMKYRQYSADGNRFFAKKKIDIGEQPAKPNVDSDTLFQMEECLRKVIDKLKITKL